METSAPAKKKFPWKVTLIIVAVLISVAVIVGMVRRNKKAEMIKAIKASGTSLTDDLLNAMSYSDIKKLYEATTPA